LFIAILLENFDEGVLKQKMHEYEQSQQEKNRRKVGLGPTLKERALMFWNDTKTRVKKWWENKFKKSGSQNDEEIIEMTPEQVAMVIDPLHKMGMKKQPVTPIKRQMSSILHPEGVSEIVLEGYSFGCISPMNGIRRFFFLTVTHRRFDMFIICIIIISAIQLAMETPLLDP